MRFATFYRNVNVGRPGSPSTAALVAAFEGAGAGEVATFLTHGNVVFSAPDSDAADRVVVQATETLRRECALHQPAFTRSVRALGVLARAEPFEGAPTRDVYQQVVTFLSTGAGAGLALPLATPRLDVEVVRVVRDTAFSVTRKVAGTAGPANAFLERASRAPATTRQWSTVIRLLERWA